MLRKTLIIITLFIFSVLLLFYFDVLWKSPSFYKTVHQTELRVPIMDMETYMDNASNHRRPYIYSVDSKSGGKAIIVGVTHTNDPNKSHFDSIKHYWEIHKPTVALVEGRMGFFFSWIHNSIEEYGESGLTTELAKKNNVDVYTWEPSREDEIDLLIKEHSAKKLAMFYSIRPFFQLSEQDKVENGENELQALIEERTDYKQLKNSISRWQQIDSIWKVDFPELNWKTYNPGYGYPGYLHDIWNSSNLSRDKHMLDIISEQVKKGEIVFVTMGASHAPRIENALKSIIQ